MFHVSLSLHSSSNCLNRPVNLTIPTTEFISILTPIQKKKERHDFSAKVKREVVHKQKGRCVICGAYLNKWERDFHHKDGNKTNNKLPICQAVHTRCHRKKHAEKMSNKQCRLFCTWIGRRGLIALLLALAGAISFGGTGTAFADPQHCYPYGECYNIGYAHGYADGQNIYSPVDACYNHTQAYCDGYHQGYRDAFSNNANSGLQNNWHGTGGYYESNWYYQAYNAGYQQGLSDGQGGLSYDCSGHTSYYCSGYGKGYSEGQAQQANNQQPSQENQQNQESKIVATRIAAPQATPMST